MNLITDRTEDDVLLENEKGLYGYSDLNRVEEAVKEISGYFSRLGISLDLQTKTDWGEPGKFSAETWPVQNQMIRYLGNVAAIKNLFPSTVMLPESMDDLTWSGANNIEKVLETAFERIDGVLKIYRYSGEIFAGEE